LPDEVHRMRERMRRGLSNTRPAESDLKRREWHR